MKKSRSLCALAFTALLVVANALQAQVPQLINYQGRIVVGTTNFNGSGLFSFALVNTGGSTTYWSNDGTSTAGSQPTAAISLTVTNGLYSLLLGDTTLTNMTAVPASVFTNPDVRLRVWFNDGTHGFQQLTPDQRISAVGYAMIANGVVPAGITSSMIASGAVGSAQLASGISITGTLTGNASTATSALAATSAGSFTGSLAGDVTGTQGATVVALVGGSTAANVHSAELAANAATNLNTAGVIVKRDASGNFSVGTVTAAGGFSLPATDGSGVVGVITQNGGPLIHSYGTNNYFVGFGSGNFTLTGVNNSAIGINTLTSNTTGSDDTASGAFALVKNTTGGSNTASGYNALNMNTTGYDNTAMGANSLANNTTGVQNTAVGINTLLQNTMGSDNTACGPFALVQNTTGGSNTASGYGALNLNTIGNYNTAYGNNALSNSTTGSSNTALGNGAGSNLTTGSNNIDIGHQGVAGESNVIRIGDGTTQTDTYLTGVIHGNGSGLTNMPAANITGNLTSSQLASGLTLGGTTTGTFNGNVTGNATSANSFSGSLVGDVTGTQGATVVALVGTSSAANVHAAEIAANAATNSNAPSTIVERDGSGNFSAGTITTNGGLILPVTTSSTVGVITQNGNPLIHSYGTDNFFAGPGAGNFTMTGTDNTAIGYQCFSSSTVGGFNAATGSKCLSVDTTGSFNGCIARSEEHASIGVRALLYNEPISKEGWSTAPAFPQTAAVD